MNPNGARRALTFHSPPQRVVSLVPSLTESLFDLGIGQSLVGITDYCIHPANETASIFRVGGTKNPDIEKILALDPDLIIANQEENSPETILALEQHGLRCWVNFPKTVAQSMDVLWLIVGIYQSHTAALRLDTLQRSLDWTTASVSEISPWRYFCPIWQSQPTETAWWMTFNSQTYIHDVLKIFSGINCFADRQRRYPLLADLGLQTPDEDTGRDTRYPRITRTEIIAVNPEVIILPTEPYPYTMDDISVFKQIFSETQAAQNNRIYLLEGSMLTWHGTRLGKALTYIPDELHIYPENA